MTTLKKHILDVIRTSGPISLARYMEICLTHPKHGYYTSKTPLGREGDFITAPEISQMFGELIGLFLADYWLGCGRPEPVSLIELGPGRGTLMKDALRAMKIVPGLNDASTVHFVEVSDVLKKEQKKAVQDAAWAESLDDVDPSFSLIIANEFFDCLPIRQFVKTDSGWAERMVGEDDSRLIYTLDDRAVPATVSGGATGDIKEISPQADYWIEAIGARLRASGGLAVIIDYGYAKSAFGDTFQAIQGHKYIDPLEAPGESDLTAHVDFETLKEKAERAGLAAFGPVTQGRFLQDIGIEHRAGQLLDAATKKQRQDIFAAVERLVMPAGMGDLFKVLVLAKDETPAPAGFGDGDQ